MTEKTPDGGKDAIAAREALINGQPPRIPPLAELNEEALALTGRLRQIGSGRPPPTSMAEVPELLGIMLRHPQLYERTIDMGIQLGLRGALSAHDRELVVLRIGWLCLAPFEWGEHVKKAKALGFTSEDIERITIGSSAPGWGELDGAILRAVEELRADAMISDATWAILASHYNDKQLIELPILVGQYQMIAYSQNSLRIRLTEGNHGLTAR
jgi:alkylhydroperoxidase family enzyme